MINLAGNKDADKHIKEELYLADIEQINVGGTVKSEVPYSIIGRIGNWKLYRAWYYWVATVERREDGLPLEAAMKLHNTPHPTEKIMGNTIRSGGHCGCPAPDEYGAQPVHDEELENKLIELGYEKTYSDFMKKSYVSITVGELSKLSKEGKLKVNQYVDCYHIDDQIGLNEFAKTIKSLNH
jgi:hypothetical protein